MSSNLSSPLKRLLLLIDEKAADPNITFDAKTTAMGAFVGDLNNADLKQLLAEAGFIPEKYGIDSSEEKVYAKAMDILVAASLSRLGYKCEVSAERSNSADVTAECAAGRDRHTLVLDAKAFRLSRTALNPKDYKIEALNTWRKTAHFAALVAPLAGFPAGNSRLYKEAITFNVTLLTFSHIQFMLEKGLPSEDALHGLWNISEELEKRVAQSPSAEEYWAELDKTFCQLLNAGIEEWKDARNGYFTAMLTAADQQIAFFEEQKQKVASLSREELIPLVTKVMGLDQKIIVIRRKKHLAELLLKSIEEAE